MTSSIFLLKIGGSIGAASAVAGGSYVAYQNSDSIKKFFSIKTNETSNEDTAKPKEVIPTSSNLFLVRYKEGRPTSGVAIDTNTTLSCDYDLVTKGACKIYKFASPKLVNSFNASDISGLVAPTNTNDFADNTYFVIELTGTTKTAVDLQNKTFTVKSGETTQGTFDFDQIIFADADKTNAKPATAVLESYIVKKDTTWSVTNAPASYGCKLPKADSKVDNYDFSCSLVKISLKANTDTITEFAHLKSLDTKLAASAIKDDTDTFYKLIVNKDLLYNLDFSETTDPIIELVVIDQANSDIGKLQIKQKLVSDKYIGKTDLLLTQVTKTPTTANSELTNATCSFEATAPTQDGQKIPCSLYAATNTANKPTKELVLGATVIAATEPFTANTYYTIKLTNEKAISAFDGKTEIYYHIPGTDGSTHKTVSLNIIALMSGDSTETNKPMFITEPKTTTQPKTQE